MTEIVDETVVMTEGKALAAAGAGAEVDPEATVRTGMAVARTAETAATGKEAAVTVAAKAGAQKSGIAGVQVSPSSGAPGSAVAGAGAGAGAGVRAGAGAGAGVE